jgi:hypothetical protein
LRRPYQICLDRLPRFVQAMYRSVGGDVHINMIYLTCHTSLLSGIFISFRIIVIQLNCGHSKFAIEFDQYDSQCSSGSGGTSSESTHGRAGSLEVCTVAASSPGRPESSECIDFLGRRGTLGTIPEGIVGLFWESSTRFIHSHIIIATIQRTSGVTQSAFAALSCSMNCPPPSPHKPTPSLR